MKHMKRRILVFLVIFAIIGIVSIGVAFSMSPKGISDNTKMDEKELKTLRPTVTSFQKDNTSNPIETTTTDEQNGKGELPYDDIVVGGKNQSTMGDPGSKPGAGGAGAAGNDSEYHSTPISTSSPTQQVGTETPRPTGNEPDNSGSPWKEPIDLPYD